MISLLKNKNINKLIVTVLTIFAMSSNVAVAQIVGQTRTLRDVAILIVGYLNIAIYLIMALAVLLFVWNVFKYFFLPDKDKVEAGKYVLYSVIGFAVILTFWGLVQLVINTTGLNNSPGGLSGSLNGSVNGVINRGPIQF